MQLFKILLQVYELLMRFMHRLDDITNQVLKCQLYRALASIALTYLQDLGRTLSCGQDFFVICTALGYELLQSFFCHGLEKRLVSRNRRLQCAPIRDNAQSQYPYPAVPCDQNFRHRRHPHEICAQ